MPAKKRKNPQSPVNPLPPEDRRPTQVLNAMKASRREHKAVTRSRRSSVSPAPSSQLDWSLSTQGPSLEKDSDSDDCQEHYKPVNFVQSQAEIDADLAIQLDMPTNPDLQDGPNTATPRASLHNPLPLPSPTPASSARTPRSTENTSLPSSPISAIRRGHDRPRASQKTTPDIPNKSSFSTRLESCINNEQERLRKRCTAIQEIGSFFDTKIAELQDPDVLELFEEAKDQVIPLLESLIKQLPKENAPAASQPSKPKTYAEAANSTPPSGLASSQHAQLDDPFTSPRPRSSSNPKSTNTSPQNPPDHRLFIRLSADSPLKKADPFIILNKLRTLLKDEAHLIHTIQRTNSGFAVVPNKDDSSAKDRLLQLREPIRELLGATRFEENVPWVTIIFPSVPKTLHDGLASYSVTPDLLRTEIITNTGLTPNFVNWTRSSLDHPTRGAVIASFPAHSAPPNPFRLFCLGPLSRTLPARKHTLQQCLNCYGWHSNSSRCWKESRCKLCGRTSAAHGPSPCQDSGPSLKCLNCGGPHPADDTNCPARPPLQNGKRIPLTKSQLKAIRTASAAERLQQQNQNPTSTPQPSPSSQEEEEAPLPTAPEEMNCPPTNA